MVVIKLVMIDKSMKPPKYAHPGDAGLDLYSRIDCILKPMQRKKVPTGIKIAIPDGYAGYVQPKSGLALNNGIGLLNSPGLIDSGYRGEICAIIINMDQEKDFIIKKGDKICQLVIKKIEKTNIEFVDNLNDTERQNWGFGSSGR